jgi:hypothetical protein
MSLLGQSYRRKLPWQVGVVLVFLVALTLWVGIYFVRGLLGFDALPNSTSLGTQGDFFGGHLAAILGSATLIVVIITGYLQMSEDRRFRVREMFLTGIGTISNYEAQEEGIEQAMRLLDYLSLVALEMDQRELFLILNTVMTRAIRKKLEEIEKAGGREYPNAVNARNRAAGILEEHYRAAHAG